jgi:hypothetical protein
MFATFAAFMFLLLFGLLCVVRRERLKLEKEKEWEKNKKNYKYKDWRY